MTPNKLYHAVNLMLAELGAKGEINTMNPLVTKLMDVLHHIDGGVYQKGHKLVPLEASEERQKAFAKVWFKSGWAHWSTNLSVDKERFNAAYKAMIGVSDE